MKARIVEQVEGWDASPYTGGYEGLRDLADAGFSGAISAGAAWLFMLNGRGVGAVDGSLSSFEGRDGTAYAAPDPALPLLFAMWEQDGETQARYYTNDTPLAEANRTLSEGGFTGYVDLSENVLSGDYYTVYYGGRSMNAAFVGASERLLTGDEAAERANDEVGIYEVVSVDLDILDIPEPSPSAGAGDADGPTSEPDSDAEPDAVSDPAAESDSDSEPDRDAAREPTRDEATASERAPTEARAESEPEPEREPASEPERPTPEREPSSGEKPPRPSRTPPAADAQSSAESESAASDRSTADPLDEPARSSGAAEGAQGDEASVFSEEKQWRETKSIPSLDPEKSSDGRASGAAQQAAARQKRRAKRASESRQTRPEPARARPSRNEGAERVRELTAALEQRKERIEQLETEVERLRATNEQYEEERAELTATVERLERELAEARASASGASAAPAGRSLSPDEALAGTNLFVRYASKGDATLVDARDGNADRDDVNANLKLEHHTQFDADEVAVEGEPYASFLRATIQHRFVEWVVSDLLYEIRDTGHRGGLKDLYDALPRVDRAELDGTVTVTSTEEGEQVEREQRFDVILRDRMGNPLLVANLSDSRDPATDDVMKSLVEAANGVAGSHEGLGAAFYVTASFFEPGALETAADATGGSLLRREKRESYVKLARKRGYHLCLAESRGAEFHVTVPEL